MVDDSRNLDVPLRHKHRRRPVRLRYKEKLLSIFGDLAASAIKRNHDVKDYGKLIPGHGGIMDRFDSYSFVMPTLYALISLVISLGA